MPRAVLGARNIELGQVLHSTFSAVRGAKNIELGKVLHSTFPSRGAL
jgi:hypothetical protein